MLLICTLSHFYAENINIFSVSLSLFLSLVEPVDSRPSLDRGIPTRPGWYYCYTTVPILHI